jgi:hypothetical protein
MKKVIVLIFTAFFLLTICACNNKNPEDGVSSDASVVSSEFGGNAAESLAEDYKANAELRDVFSFVDTNTGVVALKKDGGQVKIYDNSDWGEFSVTGNKMYVKVSSEKAWGYIDLNNGDGNYELVKFPGTDERSEFLTTFTALDDCIYYIEFLDDSMYRYDTESNTREKVVNVSKDMGVLKSCDNEKLLFYYSGEGRDIYMYDTKNGQETKIVDNAILEFINGDKLVYYIDEIDGTDEDRVRINYEYDILTGKHTEIAKTLAWGYSLSGSPFVPYEGGYMYLDNSKLYKTKIGGEPEIVYTFDEEGWSYGVIDLLAPNKIICTFESMVSIWSEVFDIDTQTIEQGSFTSFGFAQYVDYENHTKNRR